MNPEFIYIDLFCGAGGTTTGIHMAVNERKETIAIVAACVNHDPMAIKSHWANHPEVEHFEEDIRILDLTRLVRLINMYRAFYPNAKIVLWASLECTNFSKAKGGLPRDADNSTLAQLGMNIIWKLFRESRISHHGCYLNLETMSVNPIKV